MYVFYLENIYSDQGRVRPDRQKQKRVPIFIYTKSKQRMDYKWQVLGISNVVKWITPGKGTLNRYVTPGSEFCVENGWKWRRGGGYQLLYTVISKDVKNKTPIFLPDSFYFPPFWSQIKWCNVMNKWSIFYEHPFSGIRHVFMFSQSGWYTVSGVGWYVYNNF